MFLFHSWFSGLFSLSFLFTCKFIFHFSCRCYYWDLVGFRNFIHTSINLLFTEKLCQRGSPHDRLEWGSCLPLHKHLTSANRHTGETGVKRVCFRLWCLHINYNLTVDLWCFYCSEASNSWFIKGKTLADLTRGRLRMTEGSQGLLFCYRSNCAALSLKVIWGVEGTGWNTPFIRGPLLSIVRWSGYHSLKRVTAKLRFNTETLKKVCGNIWIVCIFQYVSRCLQTKGTRFKTYVSLCLTNSLSGYNMPWHTRKGRRPM